MTCGPEQRENADQDKPIGPGSPASCATINRPEGETWQDEVYYLDFSRFTGSYDAGVQRKKSLDHYTPSHLRTRTNECRILLDIGKTRMVLFDDRWPSSQALCARTAAATTSQRAGHEVGLVRNSAQNTVCRLTHFADRP